MRAIPTLTFVSLLSLLGAGCASKQIIVQPFGPKPLAPKVWQNVEEAQLAATARETREPAAAQLAALENWEAKFPNSDYADLRLEQKIVAYQRLQKLRELFDTSKRLLEIDPYRLRAIIGITISVPRITPTNDEMAFAEAACRRIVDVPDVVFNHADASLQSITRLPITVGALTTLGWIDTQRHDNATAILDYYYLLALDPTQARASYALATALLAQREDPRAQRTAIFHFARAAVYDGPNALPPEQRKAALDYVNRIYRLYFGSAEGFDNLAAMARSNAFPSGEFR